MNCIKTIVTEAVECNCGALQLTIPNTVLHHGDRIRICIAQKPTGTEAGNDFVTVKNGRGTFSVIHDRSCNAYGVLSELWTGQKNKKGGGFRPRLFLKTYRPAM